MVLQDEVLKTVTVCGVAAAYFAVIGNSFPAGGTAIVAVSLVQVFSLFNSIVEVQPQKFAKRKLAEPAPGPIRTVVPPMPLSLLREVTFCVLAMLGTRALAHLGVVHVWPMTAAVASATGALARYLNVGRHGGDDSSERQHLSPALWYPEEERQQVNGEAPIA